MSDENRNEEYIIPSEEWEDAQIPYPDAPAPVEIDGLMDAYMNTWLFSAQSAVSQKKDISPGMVQMECREVIRKVIMDVLGWSAEDAFDRIDKAMMNGMALSYYFRRVYGTSTQYSAEEKKDLQLMVYELFSKELRSLDDKELRDRILAKAQHRDTVSSDTDWYAIVGRILAGMGGRSSMEEIYARWSRSEEMYAYVTRKNIRERMKKDVCYPVQWLEAYLVRMSERGEEGETERSLYCDDFLYTCAIIRAMTDRIKKK